MSPSTRVVTGVDDRGRPKAEWRPMPGVSAELAYGHMEPAYSTTIERRQATPEELAAAMAREAEPSHLTRPTNGTPGVIVRGATAGPTNAERMQMSRQRGAERHVAVVAAKRATPAPAPPPEEEPAVSEAAPDRVEADVVETELGQLERLYALQEATSAARDAWISKHAADVAAAAADSAWATAQAELALAAVAALNDETAEADVDVPPDDDHAHYVLTLPIAPDGSSTLSTPPSTVNGGGPVRSRTGEGQRPGQASERDQRAALVMGAMARLGDDMGAVAAELGMKKNAVAQVVKFARRREAQAPA